MSRRRGFVSSAGRYWVVTVLLVLAACTAGSDDCDTSTAPLASCIYIAESEGVTYVDYRLARPVPKRLLGDPVEGALPPCTSPAVDYDCEGAPPRPTPEPITFRSIKGIPAGWALVHERTLGMKNILVPADENLEPDFTGAPDELRRLIEQRMPKGYDSPFE